MSENNIKEITEEDVPLEKPIKKVDEPLPITKEKKPKKPRTPAQLKQFEDVRNKRKEIIKQKDTAKRIEASKLLLENGYVKKEDIKPVDEIKPEKKVVPKPDITTDESEAESEIIIVKKKKKPKKKTYIIEESSDDEDYEINKAKEVYNKSRNMVNPMALIAKCRYPPTPSIGCCRRIHHRSNQEAF